MRGSRGVREVRSSREAAVRGMASANGRCDPPLDAHPRALSRQGWQLSGGPWTLAGGERYVLRMMSAMKLGWICCSCASTARLAAVMARSADPASLVACPPSNVGGVYGCCGTGGSIAGLEQRAVLRAGFGDWEVPACVVVAAAPVAVLCEQCSPLSSICHLLLRLR